MLVDAGDSRVEPVANDSCAYKLTLLTAKERWSQHFPHPRTSLWALIADDNKIALPGGWIIVIDGCFHVP